MSTAFPESENQDEVLCEQHDGVAVLTLNRPKALNAINIRMITSLHRHLESLAADPNIGAVVVTGGDETFAAGADVKEMAELDYPAVYRERFIWPWEYLAQFGKPTIAAVSGYAFGGGCELAMMCDILYASESAQFSQPELGVGTIPGAGGSQRLTRAVGRAKAMDMILTGRRMGAEEAERSGLVARVFPVDRLVDEAIKAARRIARSSPILVQMAREAVGRAQEVSLAEGLRFEKSLFHASFATKDRKEGMDAFVTGRKPTFIGQ